MKKPTIGIVGYKFEERSFGAGINYLEFVSTFGNPRILMPWEEKVDVDLLFLPGGMDTSPSSYSQVPKFNTGNHDVFKEFFFKERLKNYVGNTPIFGVCLGFQMLNIYLGGSLEQDLLFHAQSSDRWQTAHKVHAGLRPDGKVDKKSPHFSVNSHHHQAVTLKSIAPVVKPLLFAENEDFEISGEPVIVEAFECKKMRIGGVQYHPKLFGAC